MFKKTRRLNRLKNKYPKIIEILKLVLVIIGGIWVIIQIINYFQGPEILFSLYTFNDKGEMILLNETNRYKLIIDGHALETKNVSVPINIAFLNKGQKSAELMQIKITYDSTLNISSNSKRLISSTPGKLVFQHDMEYLNPAKGDSYTPIKDLDVVYLSIEPIIIPAPVLTKDGVPFYTIILASLFKDKQINLNIEIVAKDMKPITKELILSAPFIGIDLLNLPEDKNIKLERINNFSFNFSNFTILDSWSEKIDENIMKYYKLSRSKETIQIIYVNNQLRRVIMDNDGDGFIDEDYADTTFDGILDLKIVYSVKHRMIDWFPHNPINQS